MTAGGDQGLTVDVAQDGPIPLHARFSCAPGRVLALVGPSGSGKTTLLRCIAGLYAPAEGQVRCHGETWLDTAHRVDVPTQARRVGFVFQNYALFPHLTAVQNVVAALGDRYATDGERTARAFALLERVHLRGLESRRPHQLSGGQQQRVAVARALARDPQVLLLDEPFAAVDRVTRRKLYVELAEMRKDLAMPVVLVTHDLDEAAMLCDQLCILHRGTTLQQGPAHDVMSRPATMLVARLVDLRNVFSARVHGHERECTLLDWNGARLEAQPAPSFAPGEQVAWTIPADGVILHRRDRPSRGEHENPLHGTVVECLSLGSQTHIVVHVDDREDMALKTTVSAHVAERNRIALGERIGLSLLAASIHVMPWEPGSATSAEGEAAVL